MPRIEPIDGPPRDAVAAELLHFADAYGAPDPRMARIFARSEAATWFLRAWKVALHDGLLPHRLKELVRIRTSVAFQCGYCSSIISKRAAAEGMTQEIVLEMMDLDAAPSLDEREKAALRFAELYQTHDEDNLDSDAVFETLRRHFSDEEILELAVLMAFLTGGSKFAKALQVVTWEEACEINPHLGRAAPIAAE